MKKLIISIILVGLCHFHINAQIKSKLSKEKLISDTGLFNTDTIQVVEELPMINVKKLLEEDKIEESMGFPYRFGKEVDVHYTSALHGKWFVKDQGKVWKLKIKSESALSLNLVFSQLDLPGNSELYIYNQSKTMIYGPITGANVKKNKPFGSDIIQGNSIILELFEPKEVEGMCYIEIDKVVHGYKSIFPQAFLYGDGDDCHIDVNCYTGSIRDQSDGVVMILLGYSRLCSGVLLNNGCQDFTPNILTAFHCIDIGDHMIPTETSAFDGVLSTTEENRVNSWKFRFQYKSPSCNGPEPPSYTYFTYDALDYISGWVGTDFALVEMDEIPDGRQNIKYQGWSRSGNAASYTRTYGHPKGDVMKFAYDNTPAESVDSDWIGGNGFGKYLAYPSGNFWQVYFTAGGIEGGSSGGPLVDGAGRVVGQLWGGITCPSASNGKYGKLSASWVGNNTNDERLDIWLTNDQTITTTNLLKIPYVQQVSGNYVVSTSSYAGVSLINPPPSHTVNWTVSSNLYIVSQGSTSALVRWTGSNNGEATLTANVQNSNSTLCPVSSPFSITFQAGPFTTSQISLSGQTAVCPSSYYTYTANIPGGHQSGYSYSWTYPSGWSVSYQSTNTIRLYTGSNPSYGTVRVSVNNGAGSSGYTGVTVYPNYNCGYYYSYSPNPVNNELNVEVKPLTTEETIEENKTALNNIIFSVQLINEDQMIVFQKNNVVNKIKIKTRDLKKGNYFLHITDNMKTIKEQVIIE